MSITLVADRDPAAQIATTGIDTLTTLLGTPDGNADVLDLDDDYELDMRVVKSLHPRVDMMCDTSDGCGETCQGSACASVSNDPS